MSTEPHHLSLTNKHPLISTFSWY